MSRRKWGGCACVGFGIALAGSSADASLLVDLRGPGGVKQVTLSAGDPGKPITLDVYARVTGQVVGQWEALKHVQGSFVSTGTTLGQFDPAGDWDSSGTYRICAKAPFNGMYAALGRVQDIDGDGDLDLGGRPGAPQDEWVVFRTDYPSYGLKPGQGTRAPNGTEFLIGAITFTPTQLGGDTRIRFLPRTNAAGVITEDAGMWWERYPDPRGGYLLGPFLTSDFLVLVVPEPGVLPLLGIGLVGMSVGLWRRRSADGKR